MITLQWRGEAAFSKRLRDAASSLKNDIATELETFAQSLASTMRERVDEQSAQPTGELAQSITVEREGEHALRIRASAPHAAYVEFGTSSKPAKPFFNPVVEEAQQHGLPWLHERLSAGE